MKLDQEIVINKDQIQQVNFYPYYEPKEDLLIAVCEIYFWHSQIPTMFFDYDAQRVYNFYESEDYGHLWVKKIAWS